MRHLHTKVTRVPWGLVGVLLLLIGASGCALFFNKAPTAGFTASALAGQAPLTVNFSAVPSTDADGTITGWEWDFGDGGNGIGEAVSHTYTAGGSFTAVLRVTDDDGAQATAQKTITVLPPEPPGPEARFTASPTSGTSPLVVQFDASGSTYAQAPLAYSWTFGDGGTSVGATVSHLYVTATTRTYTVTLTVRGPDGKQGTATGSIAVTGAGGGGGSGGSGAPSARFAADPVDGIAPLTVDFDPSDSEAATDRILTTYTWSFGDLGTVTTNNPDVVTHTYRTALASQVFTATLIVIDDLGKVGTATKTIKAKNRQPVAGFEIQDGAAVWQSDDVTYYGYAAPLAVAVRSLAPTWVGITLPNEGSTRPTNHVTDDKNLSYDPEGHQPASGWGVAQYDVTWGDVSAPQAVFADGGGGLAVTHTYALAADEQQKTFTIKVDAIDALGARATLSRTITITRAAP